MNFHFDNSFARLPAAFFEEAFPESVEAPRMIHFNHELAEDLGITNISSDEILQIFSGNKIPDGSHPIAMAYAGHQFAHFVPQLGDGRAMLLGEVVHKDKRFDIQLKGAGRTFFSRRGDGKSPIGPVIREYLMSEAMHFLRVPTTRALCAIASGEKVLRERTLPGGVFTRVASSHIRVGTFEFFAARRDLGNLNTLLRYAAKRHFPDLDLDSDHLVEEFLDQVVARQAELIAKWMSLGFVHGVMNTDNFSISGETIDYGPCAYMEEFRSDQVFSSIDRDGRYAFNQQPGIGLWNLSRLAECLIPLAHPDPKQAQESLEKILSNFAPRYRNTWLNHMGRKLGILSPTEEDHRLIVQWLDYMEKNNLDFTQSFVHLTHHIEANFNSDLLPNFDTLSQILKERLMSQRASTTSIVDQMRRCNPLFIMRNHLVQKAIEDYVVKNDLQTFNNLIQLLKSPFKRVSGFESYYSPASKEEKVCKTFCGT